MEETLYIVAPAYNEAENIECFVSEWHPVIEHFGGPESKLVVIDDGSTDDTYLQLSKLEGLFPQLHPVTKENSGHGPTVLYGYRFALDNGAAFIFQTDTDGQTNPDEFSEFWDLRHNYDAIIGNRSQRGDGFGRVVVSRVVCLLVKLFFGVSIPDANTPFRLMRASYLERILPFIPKDYNVPNIILSALGPALGEKVCFKEISFTPRSTGKNSLRLSGIVSIGFQSLSSFAAIRKKLNAHLNR